jgi:hypothetical protein
MVDYGDLEFDGISYYKKRFKPIAVGNITAGNSGDTAHRVFAVVHDPGCEK